MIKNFVKKHIKGIIYILSCLILGILFYYYIATSVLSSFVILAMGQITKTDTFITFTCYSNNYMYHF